MKAYWSILIVKSLEVRGEKKEVKQWSFILKVEEAFSTPYFDAEVIASEHEGINPWMKVMIKRNNYVERDWLLFADASNVIAIFS